MNFLRIFITTPLLIFALGVNSIEAYGRAPSLELWPFSGGKGEDKSRPCNGQRGSYHVNPNGTPGGFVAASAYVDIGAIVSENSQVCDRAKVHGEAIIRERSRVFGNAVIEGNVRISGEAKVYGNALVRSNSVAGVDIQGMAKVYGNARIEGDALVAGKSEVYGSSLVRGNTRLFGKAKVYGRSLVEGESRIFGKAEVADHAIIQGSSRVCDDVRIGEAEHLENNVDFCSKTEVVTHIQPQKQIASHYELVALDTPGEVPPEGIYRAELRNSDGELFYGEVLSHNGNFVFVSTEIEPDHYSIEVLIEDIRYIFSIQVVELPEVENVEEVLADILSMVNEAIENAASLPGVTPSEIEGFLGLKSDFLDSLGLLNEEEREALAQLFIVNMDAFTLPERSNLASDVACGDVELSMREIITLIIGVSIVSALAYQGLSLTFQVLIKNSRYTKTSVLAFVLLAAAGLIKITSYLRKLSQELDCYLSSFRLPINFSLNEEESFHTAYIEEDGFTFIAGNAKTFYGVGDSRNLNRHDIDNLNNQTLVREAVDAVLSFEELYEEFILASLTSLGFLEPAIKLSEIDEQIFTDLPIEAEYLEMLDHSGVELLDFEKEDSSIELTFFADDTKYFDIQIAYHIPDIIRIEETITSNKILAADILPIVEWKEIEQVVAGVASTIYVEAVLSRPAPHDLNFFIEVDSTLDVDEYSLLSNQILIREGEESAIIEVALNFNMEWNRPLQELTLTITSSADAILGEKVSHSIEIEHVDDIGGVCEWTNVDQDIRTQRCYHDESRTAIWRNRTYHNGVLIDETFFNTEGLLDGVKRQWMVVPGQLSALLTYENGVRSGPFEFYWGTGWPDVIGSYREGVIHGEVQGCTDAGKYAGVSYYIMGEFISYNPPDDPEEECPLSKV